MSRSSHPPRTSLPRSSGNHRCNRKRLERLPLGEQTDELLPRVLGYYTRLCALPRRTRRALVRQWRRSLSAIALLLALGQAPALAATINVDGTTCTLVDAITSANTDAAAGGCPAGNGADTIVLPTRSTQSLTSADNSTLGPTGLPLITSTVTLQGRNSTIQRESGAPAFRILAVASSGDLTLHSTTVSGGGGYDYLLGGGVYNSGILTLTNSTVSGNSVYRGNSGVSNSGTLTLTNSTVSGNSLYCSGMSCIGTGGVDNSGMATLTHSTVSGNSGARFGGSGVSNSGILTLTNSTVSGNSNYSPYGGGGVDNSGTLTLTNSTVSGNYSGSFGGGVYNSGTLTLTNSTVSGNSAYSGGGVSNSGTLTLTRALISGNNITNPSPDSPYSDSTEVFSGSEATIVANNHNLFGHDGDAGVVGFSPGPTDLVPSYGLGAILNTTLAGNGGPTRTHALVAGSPALDASPDDADCAATDQRGVSRPQGAACDIGAFEAGASHTDNGDGTITDNNTGLQWEKKSDDGTIHDKDNIYTWEEAFAVHVAGLNTEPCFSGHCDWRVPNVKELQSIVNYGVRFPGPVVSLAFNNNCVGATVLTGSCTAASLYWSATTSAGNRARRRSPNFAWFVGFVGGSVRGADKGDGLRVRAVRGGPP